MKHKTKKTRRCFRCHNNYTEFTVCDSCIANKYKLNVHYDSSDRWGEVEYVKLDDAISAIRKAEKA